MTKKITLFVLLGVALVLIGYDVFAALQGSEWTETYLIRTAVREYPIMGVAFGIVAGYWLRAIKAAQETKL